MLLCRLFGICSVCAYRKVHMYVVLAGASEPALPSLMQKGRGTALLDAVPGAKNEMRDGNPGTDRSTS